MTIGCADGSVEAVVSRCRAATKRPLIVKLTPNVTDVDRDRPRRRVRRGRRPVAHQHAARHGRRRGAPPPRARARRGRAVGPGRQAGGAAHGVGVHKAVDVPLLGMGGICDGRPTPSSSCSAGATAVAVGTANFVNPHATVEIIDGMAQYCERHGVKDVQRADRSVGMVNSFEEIPARDRVIVALDCGIEEAFDLADAAAGQGHVDEGGHDAVLRERPGHRRTPSRSAASRCSSTSSSMTSRTRWRAPRIAAAGSGADMLTMHTVGGVDMMAAAQKGASARRPSTATTCRPPSASRCSPA